MDRDQSWPHGFWNFGGLVSQPPSRSDELKLETVIGRSTALPRRFWFWLPFVFPLDASRAAGSRAH